MKLTKSPKRKRGLPQVIKVEKHSSEPEDLLDIRILQEMDDEVKTEPVLFEHACDICPRTFKTLPGLKRHKASHDRKPQENNDTQVNMEPTPRKRGRPRVIKVEKRSPEPEDLEEILQEMDDEVIENYDYIPNGMPDYLVIKNKKNINNNEDVYDFDVEKEDGPGIKSVKSEEKTEHALLEHACDICPRTFKTLPGLKRHKASHDRKPQENNDTQVNMEPTPRKRGRPRVIKVEKRSPEPEDLEEILQEMDDEVIENYDYIPNGMPDYLVIKNKKNINNNEDVYDFDVEKEDGPGIKSVKSKEKTEHALLEHACDICLRTFKTLPGLKRHKASHDRKPQENNDTQVNMEPTPRKRGRPRVIKVEKRSPEPEDLEEILQEMDDEVIENYDYIPNGMPDYLVIKNKKNINNNEDVYDFDVEKEDGPGIKSVKSEEKTEHALLEHACDICLRTFKTLPGLKRHKASHDRKPQENNARNDESLKKELSSCDSCGEDLATAHTNGDFECFDCGNFFKLKAYMERHQLMVHCYDEVLNCPTCDFSCTDKESLSEHLYSHAAGSLKPYPCLICFTSFNRKYDLVRHNMQTGCDGSVKPTFPCQVCGKVFNQKDNLRENLRAHAGQTKKKHTFNCEYCNKEFLGFALLTVHRRSHSDYRPYQCDFCPKCFPSCRAMKKHRRIHTGERPYECKQCFAKFAAKETLNRHIKTHSALKPHSCEFCGKTFIQISQLRAHLFHHTGENGFTCETCGKSFNRCSRLSFHIKYVHEGAEPYMCTVCNKALLRKEDVQRHNIIHSGVKAHACFICDKRFAMKSSLKIHLLTHTKEPPQLCNECGRSFIRQDCLLRHMRSKHRDRLAEIMADAEKKKLEALSLEMLKKDANNQIDSGENENDSVKIDDIDDDVKSIDKLLDFESTKNKESYQYNSFANSLLELLTVLIDESTLKEFGWPEVSIECLIESVIKRCGQIPLAAENDSFMAKLRDHSKQLLSIIIGNSAIQTLLINQTIEEIIEFILILAKA